MLRLAFVSTLALALAGCDQAIIAGGTGGDGGGTTTTTITTTTTTTTTSSTTTTDDDKCTPAGGSCVALVPGGCAGGVWADYSQFPCGPADFAGVGCCMPAANACEAAGGTCEPVTPGACLSGTVGDPASCGAGVGVVCCLPNVTCVDTCDSVGAMRCAADWSQLCVMVGGCLSWVDSAPCVGGCNATGTTCIDDPLPTCASDASCGCGCACIGGTCECTGAIPPTCNTDAECGPPCSGLHCVAGACQVAVCTPGADQTCNDSPSMSALAGHCNADASCTCNAGYTKQPSGKCGL